MKGTMLQGNFNFYSDNPLEEIQARITGMKKCISDMRSETQGLIKRTEGQKELLKETSGLLKDIQTILFEMRQGELFDDESTETFEQLREIIGEEQAGKVARAFAGTMVYIPKNVIVKNLHKKIKKEFWDGASYKELGRRYGYTERNIRNIVDRK